MDKNISQDQQGLQIVKSQIIRGFCNFAKANYGLDEKETVKMFEKMLEPKLESLLSEISQIKDRQQDLFQALQKLFDDTTRKAYQHQDRDWQAFMDELANKLSVTTISQLESVLAERFDELEKANEERHKEIRGQLDEIRKGLSREPDAGTKDPQNPQDTSSKRKPSKKLIRVIIAAIILAVAVILAGVGFGGKSRIAVPKNSGEFEYENFWVTINKDGQTATISIFQPTEEINIPPIVTDKDGKSYTVTSIGKAKMADNNKAQTVSMPNGIITIEAGAFANFNSLKQITLPDGIETIGQDAFLGCSQLQTVNVNSLESWCKILFEGKNSNPLSVAENSKLTVGNKPFVGDIEISEDIDTLPDYTFHNSDITSVKISATVTTIGKEVFANCTSLRKVTIPNAESSIGHWFGATDYADQQRYLPQSLKEVIIDGGEAICSNAFYGCSELTNVTIPESVTTIGQSAFYRCEQIADITIPIGVTKIEDQAFYGCSSLTSLTLSSTVTTIGKNVCENCTSLRKITVPNAESYIGRWFGATNSTDQQEYLPQSLKEVIIDGGEAIGIGAFDGCSGLTNITIPESVTTIGWSAFNGCSGLTNIIIPESVTTIGWSAFNGCSGLTNIIIPESVTTIGNQAFYGCNSLINIDMPQNITSIGYSVFDSTAFYNDPDRWQNGVLYLGPYLLDVKFNLSGNFSVQQGTKTIADWALGHSDITNIHIPASVVNIGWAIFSHCDKLESIEVDPANPNYYSSGNCLIEKNSGLLIAGCAKSIIPNGVLSIGEGAFWGQSELKSITLPAGVTELGAHAFADCTRLSDIKILGSLESIESYAFNGCRSLTEITLPESVTSIGYHAFDGCTSLRELVILDSVTSIDDKAFCGCTELISIVIGKGVTYMGSDVFENCSSLTIYCKLSEKPMRWSADWNPDNRPVVWNYTK